MRSIRRSRTAVALAAVAFLVAASGCGSEPADRETTDTIEAPGATWAPAVTERFEPRMVTSTPVVVEAPFSGLAEDLRDAQAQWLVPWDDGFLAVGVDYPSPALPDRLPPEVAELFPPEVTALFPDGLPPTQQEAVDILRDAGLLQDVMDILNEHPEAMEAVQSMPTPEPQLVAAWSSDGEAWIPTDLAAPDDTGTVTQLSVSGARLTVAGFVPSVEDGDPWTVTVASTTDLENWTTADFQVTAPVDPTAWPGVIAMAVAADDEHWVVHLAIGQPTDPRDVSNSMWSGAWGADATMTAADPRTWMLLSTNDGFLDLGDTVRFSTDGQAWTEVPGTASMGSVETAAPYGDGVLAVIGTPDDDVGSMVSSIVVLDAAGTVATEIEVPELGDAFAAWGSPTSPAFVAQRDTVDSGRPDHSLLAATDGDTWLLQDLSEDERAEDPPALVAVNGATVLTAILPWGPGSSVWQRYTITA